MTIEIATILHDTWHVRFRAKGSDMWIWLDLPFQDKRAAEKRAEELSLTQPKDTLIQVVRLVCEVGNEYLAGQGRLFQ